MTLVKDIASFFTSTKKSPRLLDANTVRRTKLDDGMFDKMVETAETFRKVVQREPTIEAEDGSNVPEELQEKFKHFPDLMGDIWKSLFTGEDPGVLGDEEIKPSRVINRKIAQRVISSEEFAAVKPGCRHAEVEACFTAMSMGEELEKLMGEEMREMVEKAEEASTKERTAELAQEKLDDLRDQAKEEHQQDGQVSDETQQAIQDAVQRKTNAREAAAKAANDANAMPITVAAGQRIDKAAQEGKKAAQVIAGLPGCGTKEETDLTTDEQLRLAQMFKDNPELFRIAEAVGRIVRDMRFKRARRIVGGAEEIVDVELGNDLPRVFPSELMLLLDEDEVFELDFFRRYTEGSLLQWSTVGSAEAGKGPLIAVIDRSYSMKGSKNVWARALALALMHISHREKRDFYVLMFAGEATEVSHFAFPHNAPMDPALVAKMAGHSLVFGTDITTGLDAARDIILKVPAFSKADIVLLSDGEDWYQDDDDTMKALLAEMGVRIHGILLGLRQSDYMDQMCDVQASAFDFTGPNAATDMLATEIT
jgi:uncharacterized protein with von Willebrand factor type A (vWA) domain